MAITSEALEPKIWHLVYYKMSMGLNHAWKFVYKSAVMNMAKVMTYATNLR
jgi:hypothetical protein